MNNSTGNHSIKFDYPIWKIHTNNLNDLIFIELRCKNNPIIQLYSLDLVTFTTQRINLPENLLSWWVTIEIIVGNVIVCSVHEDQNLPKATQLFAYDFNTNSQIWVLPNMHMVEVCENGFKTSDLTNSIRYYDYFGLETNESKLQVYQNKIAETYFSSPNSLYYADFQNLINSLDLSLPFNGVEYFETEKQLVISYNYLEDKLLNYRLLVLNNEVKVQLISDVFKNNKGLIDVTFFVFKNSVLFLEDEYTFRSYKLV